MNGVFALAGVLDLTCVVVLTGVFALTEVLGMTGAVFCSGLAGVLAGVFVRESDFTGDICFASTCFFSGDFFSSVE